MIELAMATKDKFIRLNIAIVTPKNIAEEVIRISQKF